MHIKPLRTQQSPDLPDVLLHMTGRLGRRNADLPWVGMSSVDRLASILWSRMVAATLPFGSEWPVVCFTQTTRRALSHLTLAAGRYDGTGLAFTTESVFAAGGGPAIYIRGDEFVAWQYSSLPTHMKARGVRYWPGSVPTTADDVLGMTTHGESQWLHEREWRIPRPTDAPPEWWWAFAPTDVNFLLLKDANDHARLFWTLDYWASQADTPPDTSWVRRLPVAFLDTGGSWVAPPEVGGWP
ncbi:hypothetical protein [Intrasporangium oryzae]|uniref:hypothetical protein n=1 Tax=Intrasporangium oryzae TaxID=412687 RepID=UPI0012FCD0BB|nr:hypothetical protein [Intrasporangium oryzae]